MNLRTKLAITGLGVAQRPRLASAKADPWRALWPSDASDSWREAHAPH